MAFVKNITERNRSRLYKLVNIILLNITALNGGGDSDPTNRSRKMVLNTRSLCLSYGLARSLSTWSMIYGNFRQVGVCSDCCLPCLLCLLCFNSQSYLGKTAHITCSVFDLFYATLF